MKSPEAKVGDMDSALRNPAVREILTLVTGVQPTSASIDPETAVALGAAILCSIMDNQMVDMQARIPTPQDIPSVRLDWINELCHVRCFFCLV